jgi:glycerophosphoryl diester phosphodiesterase
MQNRQKPIIIGHRGASGYRPEHTRAAYELAYAQGADAVEPDLVVSKDGVLVIRHENEISGTTDVASHPEFVGRRATKSVDGHDVTGWFTEDFTWAELRALRARERLADIRPANASYDGQFELLSLPDLLEIIERATEKTDRVLGMVAEIKHATYFESIGLPIEELYTEALADAGWPNARNLLTTESFEQTILTRLRESVIGGSFVYLLEELGTPYDRIAASGGKSITYADDMTGAGLRRLVGRVDGISVEKSVILGSLADDGRTRISSVVEEAHAVGLTVLCWTLRPENRYLGESSQRDVPDASFGDWESEFRLIMASGVDGIFVDHPDLAVAIRDGRGQ